MDGFPNQKLYLDKVVYKSSTMRQEEAMVMVGFLFGCESFCLSVEVGQPPTPSLPPPHVDVNPSSFTGVWEIHRKS